jgi:hypothetical protein
MARDNGLPMNTMTSGPLSIEWISVPDLQGPSSLWVTKQFMEYNEARLNLGSYASMKENLKTPGNREVVPSHWEFSEFTLVPLSYHQS